jgi:hypothetical protein
MDRDCAPVLSVDEILAFNPAFARGFSGVLGSG